MTTAGHKIKQSGDAVTGEAGYLKLHYDADGEAYVYLGTEQRLLTSPYSGWKNLLINGAFAIWQRQRDPTALTTYDDDTYGGADRWYLLSSQANALQTLRSDGSTQRYALWLRQSHATPTHLGLAQIIEGVNGRHLRGQPVTLSLRVRCSAAGKLLKAGVLEWSGAEDDLTTTGSHDFVSAWSADPTLAATMALPTGASYASVTTQTNTWHTLVFTAPLSTSFTNLVAFLFSADPLAQGDTLEVEAVQLEAGPVATPFEARSSAVELILCQRYFEQWTVPGAYTYLGAGSCVSAGGRRVWALVQIAEKRTVPVVDSSGAANFSVQGSGIRVNTLTSYTTHTATERSVTMEAEWTSSEGSAMAEDTSAMLRTSAADQWMSFSSEL